MSDTLSPALNYDNSYVSSLKTWSLRSGSWEHQEDGALEEDAGASVPGMDRMEGLPFEAQRPSHSVDPVESRSVRHVVQEVLAHILGRLPCPKKTPRKILGKYRKSKYPRTPKAITE